MDSLAASPGSLDSSRPRSAAGPRRDTAFLVGIALVVAIAHLPTNGRYGFHRDELQFMDDALHLDWGFVAYPPLVPFIQRIGFGVFGLSLVGLRLASVIAQAAVLVLTGLTARELGGGRLAQCIAATAGAIAPLALFNGTEFQYTSFDYLWWVLTAYLMARLLRSEDSRWWIAIGFTLGLGLMTKYSIVFFIAGIIAAVALTRLRAELKKPWFWIAVALALAIFLPNFVWLARHQFISYDFLKHIHARDLREGRTDGFLRDQFLVCTNPITAPIWIAGLFFYFSSPGKRFRPLGWMFLVPFVLFFVAKGRGYYVAAAYPILFAAGGVAYEKAAARPAKRASTAPSYVWARAAVSLTFGLFIAAGVAVSLLILPWFPVDRPGNIALENNGELREEVGWRQIVQAVSDIKDSLSPTERAHLGIVVSNYGEAGAIDLFGPAHGLPPVISNTNSGWLRGYPSPPPETLIVLGISPAHADKQFTSCKVAGHNGNRLGIKNEEADYHPDILLCGPPRKPWPEFWQDFKSYG